MKSSSETLTAEDAAASSTEGSVHVVEKLAVDVEQKCSTEETAKSGERAVTAEDDGTGERSGESSDRTTAGVADVTGSHANRIIPDQQQQQQPEEQCGKETTETGNDAEDPEISFKKPAKHETERADVDSKKEAHDVNRNSEAMSSVEKSTCCSA